MSTLGLAIQILALLCGIVGLLTSILALYNTYAERRRFKERLEKTLTLEEIQKTIAIIMSFLVFDRRMHRAMFSRLVELGDRPEELIKHTDETFRFLREASAKKTTSPE